MLHTEENMSKNEGFPHLYKEDTEEEDDDVNDDDDVIAMKPTVLTNQMEKIDGLAPYLFPQVTPWKYI